MTSDWDRVEGDPDLSARARAAYTGSGDLRDQLWWLAHPGAVAPSGRADPALAVEALRRDLYRRDPRQAADGGLAAEVAEREAVIETDRALAAAAVSSAVASAAAGRSPVRAGGSAAARPGGRPHRLALLAGAVALAVACLLVGAVAGSAVRQQPPPAPALQVFARAPRDVDRPTPQVLPALTRGATIRRLASYTSIGLVVYAARTADERICLVSVVLGEQATAACTSERAFETDGISMVVIAQSDPVDDAGRRPSSEIGLTWRPAGPFRIRALEA